MKPLRWKSLPGVESNPERCWGQVTLEGTRMPARALAGPFLAGDSIDSIERNWSVTREQVETALRFAMHPRAKAFEAAALKKARAYARSPRAWWKRASL